jgi:hypothetical protein
MKRAAWWLLLFVPLTLAVIFLYPLILPTSGIYREGWIPEQLAMLSGVPSEHLGEFASRVRLSGILEFFLAALAGIILCWFGLRTGWRRRFYEFNPDRVAAYRLFALSWCLWSFVFGAALSIIIVFFSPLSSSPGVFWLAIAFIAGILAAGQCFSTIWSLEETRRLFRGK